MKILSSLLWIRGSQRYMLEYVFLLNTHWFMEFSYMSSNINADFVTFDCSYLYILFIAKALIQLSAWSRSSNCLGLAGNLGGFFATRKLKQNETLLINFDLCKRNQITNHPIHAPCANFLKNHFILPPFTRYQITRFSWAHFFLDP